MGSQGHVRERLQTWRSRHENRYIPRRVKSSVFDAASMVTKLPRRTSFSGPALVRLLSRLGQVEVTEPRQSPAARLDEWLGWTESIVLSTVLNAAAPDSAARAGAHTGTASHADSNTVSPSSDRAGKGMAGRTSSVSVKSLEARAGTSDDPSDGVVDDAEFAQAEYAKVRDSLEQAVAAALAPPAPASAQQRRQFRGAPKSLVDVDFPSYRRRYSMLQQKMESSIAALRGRLRALLSARTPEMAQLVAVDAAMQQAMVEHELRLLAGIPNLLERRFQLLAREGLAKQSELGAIVQQPASASGAPVPETSSESSVAGQGGPELGDSLEARAALPRPEQEAKAAPANTVQARLRRAASKPELEPGPWLDTFREDMRGVLLAELDLRLQPIVGLLSALRTK